jgi:glycosyltransferase involved in cell wall biosynthesis
MEIERQLANSALAVAPYVPDELSFTRYADPGKLKTYLACGLPIVMTDVPEFAKTVVAAGAGTIVPYETEALAAAITGYLTDPLALDKARVAAASFAQNFDWERIFDDALERTLSILSGDPRNAAGSPRL